ncbi:MAG: coproporphyrinogen dehydrogenase HemZ [Butyrivibrio sp.]|nr:coproporphyrinogen dehydrogenase HemZ [Butyrivibrio sp.]
MIYMSINTHDYENDVRVMIQAFYPKEKIITDREKADECRLRTEVIVNGPRIRAHIEGDAGGGEIDCDAGTTERKAVRDRLKRELYAVYCGLTGIRLPWGTLTGIRPTKIPYSMLENGVGRDEIIERLESEYLMSKAKAELSCSVAQKEYSLLSGLDLRDGCNLYIGIPFCPTTCLYCSFTSYPLSMWQGRVDEYIGALEKELRALGDILKGKKINTVYIGGGTPTTLLPYQLDRLLLCIQDNFDLGSLCEFTVEAGRPDSIDKEKLKALRAHGVGRISVNPQTMNQRTLDLIGRRHTAKQTVRAFEAARECGFDNINMDLIAGLPDEGIDEVSRTLEETARLKPDSLTVHSLAIKRAAGLNIFREAYAKHRIENTDEIMELTRGAAARMGLEPYYLYRQKNMAGNFENVGYAKPGREGLYNILIMEEKQSVWAAGAGAQSKIVRRKPKRVDRIENVKDAADYICRVEEMIDRKRRYIDAEGNE